MLDFLQNKSGNIAVTTALLALPLLFVSGAAIDYSNLVRKKSIVQAAVDSAAIAVAIEGGTDEVALRKVAADFINNNLKIRDQIKILDLDLAIDEQSNEYQVSLHFSQINSFMQLADIEGFTPLVNARASYSNTEIEIAMVLDSTGSMRNNNKMPELKSAVRNFADILDDGDNAKVSIVPFDTQVSLDNVLFNNNALSENSNPLAATSDCSALTDPTELSLCQETVTACGFQSVGDFTLVNYTRYTSFGDFPAITHVFCGSTGITAKENTTISANVDLLGVDEAQWTGCIIDRVEPHDVTSTAPSRSDVATQYPTAFCAVDSLLPILPLTKEMGQIVRHHINMDRCLLNLS